jgi:hypothetical protein
VEFVTDGAVASAEQWWSISSEQTGAANSKIPVDNRMSPT